MAALACIGAIAVGTVVAAPAPVGAIPPPYGTPPDFSHPQAPHRPFFSPSSGDNDRPMLVIYTTFAGTQYPAGFHLPWARERYFVGTGSAAHWYQTVSRGDLVLSAAAETQGVANDGIVMVTDPDSTVADYVDTVAAAANYIPLADDFVDFSMFDRDGNEVIDSTELLIVGPVVTNNAGGKGGGYVGSHDGVQLAVGVAGVGHLTERMTIVHEIGHILVDLADHYGFGVGTFALAGPTGGAGENATWYPSTYERMHLGWQVPKPITVDGFVDFFEQPSATQAIILYDSARGATDYLMVENRWRGEGLDRDVVDQGLVIWRVDESVPYDNTTELPRPVDLLAPDGARRFGCLDRDPLDGVYDHQDGRDNDDDDRIDEADERHVGCYPGSPWDAWDPTDRITPQRELLGSTWQDGAPTNLAVRAIGRPGPVTRAYVDVRGRGVLIDAYDYQDPDRPRVLVGARAFLTFPVTNTDDLGEDAASFDVTVQVPLGWSAETERVRLGAGETKNVTITVDMGPAGPRGVVRLAARASSVEGDIVTIDPFDVVLDEPADIPLTWTHPDHIVSTSGPLTPLERWETSTAEHTLIRSIDDFDRYVAPMPDPVRDNPLLTPTGDCGTLRLGRFEYEVTGSISARVIPLNGGTLDGARVNVVNVTPGGDFGLVLANPRAPEAVVACPWNRGVRAVEFQVYSLQAETRRVLQYRFEATYRINVRLLNPSPPGPPPPQQPPCALCGIIPGLGNVLTALPPLKLTVKVPALPPITLRLPPRL